MNWYAIRTIYHFGVKNDGTNVFEERIVAFEAPDEESAFKKAEIENNDYSSFDDSEGFEIHPELELYVQDGEKLIDGYELWSQLYETNENINEFYKNRYEKYFYHPDK